MDESQQPTDEPTTDVQPVETAPAEVDQQASTDEQPEVTTAPQVEEVAETSEEVEEDDEYPTYQMPDAPQLDFNNLPVGDDNLIDPNALAGAINQQMATIEQRAVAQAQQAFQEQRAEERAWEKTYEKHPELKTNKELRDLVHRARLGEVADLLSKTQDPRSVKLPTPTQVADKFFKNISSAKQEGYKQATENVKVQNSAYVETATTKTDDSSDAFAKARQNINNPNKEVAKQARQDLLKSMLFGD